jgi:dual specificity phosphatase 12
MISQITDTLYIGDWQDATSVDSNTTDGRHVYRFTVAKDSPYVGEFFFPLVDGPEEGNEKIFWWAVDKLTELQNEKKVTLVHCMAGLSRSVSVVAAYLMKTRNIDYYDAIRIIEVTRAISVKPFFYDILTKGVSKDV